MTADTKTMYEIQYMNGATELVDLNDALNAMRDMPNNNVWRIEKVECKLYSFVQTVSVDVTHEIYARDDEEAYKMGVNLEIDEFSNVNWYDAELDEWKYNIYDHNGRLVKRDGETFIPQE